MIAVTAVVLFLIVLPLLVLWFVQRAIARQPTEFQYRLALLTADLGTVQAAIGDRLIPVMSEATRQITTLMEVWDQASRVEPGNEGSGDR